MRVTVLPRQTLSDIAIQVYGDIRGVVTIAQANDIGVTDDIEAGMILDCPDVKYDPYIQDYVRKQSLSPATELQADGEIHISIFTETFTKEFI